MVGYLIDANLPRWFSLWSADGYTFVLDIDPGWADQQIWNYASEHGLTIVTKDADFTDRMLVEGHGPHVIHIRIGNLKMAEFHRLLTPIWDDVCELSRICRLVQVYRDRVEAIE